MMDWSDKASHGGPHGFGKQPVDLMVGIVAADAVVAVREKVRLVAMVGREREAVQQHIRVLYMDVI